MDENLRRAWEIAERAVTRDAIESANAIKRRELGQAYAEAKKAREEAEEIEKQEWQKFWHWWCGASPPTLANVESLPLDGAVVLGGGSKSGKRSKKPVHKTSILDAWAQ